MKQLENILAGVRATVDDTVGYEESTHEKQAEFAKNRCWCHTCKPIDYTKIETVYMRLCPICGNKRCPKANDHNNECTNSNDTGQEGSYY